MFLLRHYRQFLFLGCAIFLLCFSQSAEANSSFSFALEERETFFIHEEARLIIPKLDVDAVIKDMGYTPEGAMAVPSNNVDVAWFSPGTPIGDVGSAVIGGHNVWNGPAVFKDLDQLIPGDAISVVNAHGVSKSFTVREKRTYNPTDDATEIFNSSSGTHLNLITCSGIFDLLTQSYPTRLVIFTDAIFASLSTP